MGDELRGELPDLGVAIAATGVVLERAGGDDAGKRGLEQVRFGVDHPCRREADLLAVACDRLPGEVRPERQAQRQVAEEGLVLEEGRDAPAEARRGVLDGAGGHQAASLRAAPGGAK